MPIPNKLEKIAVERGIPLEQLIPEQIEEHGSIYRAALALGVTPTAISYWLKTRGYSVRSKQVSEVVKDEGEEANV